MYTNDELWKKRLRHRRSVSNGLFFESYSVRASWPRDLREEFISILDIEVKSHSAHYAGSSTTNPSKADSPELVSQNIESAVTRTPSFQDLEFKIDLEEFDFSIDHSPLTSDLDAFLDVFRQKNPEQDTEDPPSPRSPNPSNGHSASPLTFISQPSPYEGINFNSISICFYLSIYSFLKRHTLSIYLNRFLDD